MRCWEGVGRTGGSTLAEMGFRASGTARVSWRRWHGLGMSASVCL